MNRVHLWLPVVFSNHGFRGGSATAYVYPLLLVILNFLWMFVVMDIETGSEEILKQIHLNHELI